jgi:hypothetical protein
MLFHEDALNLQNNCCRNSMPINIDQIQLQHIAWSNMLLRVGVPTCSTWGTTSSYTCYVHSNIPIIMLNNNI